MEFGVIKFVASSRGRPLPPVEEQTLQALQPGHKLSEGDLIKLGRFKLRVRQMVAVDDGQIQPVFVRRICYVLRMMMR